MPDTSPNAEQQAALAMRIRTGDRQAEHELVELYGKGVFTVLLAKTRSPDVARDLFQDVFLESLRALRNGNVREPERLSAFLLGVTRNVANHFVCNRGRRKFEPIEPATVIEEAPYAEEIERRQLVRHVLEQLAVEDRKILTLIMDGVTPDEIAKRVGMTPETVRQRKSRAMKRIIQFVRGLSRPKSAGAP